MDFERRVQQNKHFFFVDYLTFFVGAGAPGAPPGDPKIAVTTFFTNLSCHAVAAGRDS